MRRTCSECSKEKDVWRFDSGNLCRRCADRKALDERAERHEAEEQAFHGVEPGQHSISVLSKGIADAIIKLLDAGNLPPWKQGWQSAAPHHNAHTGYQYNGMNRWWTASKALENGWESTAWLTASQIFRMGGDILPEHHSTVIRLAVPPFRTFYIFNVEQTEGCRHGRQCLCSLCVPSKLRHSKIGDAEKIVAEMPNPPRIRLTNVMEGPPHYLPASDVVVVPTVGNYDQAERHYSTLFHELTHSTSHVRRVNRKIAGYSVNIHERAEEELVFGQSGIVS